MLSFDDSTICRIKITPHLTHGCSIERNCVGGCCLCVQAAPYQCFHAWKYCIRWFGRSGAARQTMKPNALGHGRPVLWYALYEASYTRIIIRRLLTDIINNKKAWSHTPVARFMLQGSRIAHVVETSNAKPHADMHIHYLYYIEPNSYITKENKNIPMRHSPLLCFWRQLRICEILKHQNQSVK